MKVLRVPKDRPLSAREAKTLQVSGQRYGKRHRRRVAKQAQALATRVQVVPSLAEPR